jgi:hypothetical protein
MGANAKCPGCESDVSWQWCHDVFVIDGVYSDDTELVPEDDESPTLTIHKCCVCGTIIGATGDNATFIHKDLAGIDWEEPQNSAATGQ